MPRVAVLPGSTRRASINRRLAASIADGLRRRGVEAEHIDLGQYPLPIYHGDDEAESGVPQAARDLHDRLLAVDGLIIVSPEYNGGPPALLKNAIDWISRVDRSVLHGLVVGFGAASPGGRGAVTSLSIMRSMGEHMRLDMVPGQISLPNAVDALEPDGESWRIVPGEARDRIEAYLDDFVDHLTARREHDEHSGGG